MLRKKILSCLIAILLAYGLTAHADSDITMTSADAVVINGDKLELHLDRKMRAIGNASISRGEQSIQGDVIDYDMQNDELHAKGNAILNLRDAQLSGSELHMQLSTSIGEIQDASFTMLKTSSRSNNFSTSQNQPMDGRSDYAITGAASDSNQSPTSEIVQLTLSSSQVNSSKARGDAKKILFEGQDKKQLKDARYTTCEAGVDDWYIKTKELELNNYTESGVAKNAYIEIKGVPVLYTPWIGFSFSNQRKSGLLAPTYGTTSKNGLEISVPFYWNISPDMDATLTTRTLSKRGVQLQGEFRYLEEKFSGIDSLEYLSSDNQTSENRYYASLKHQHNLGSGWSAGYSLEKVSDDEYFSDLSTRIVTTSRINLPQQFNIDYANENWRFNGLAQKFQTLDKLSYPYERLPQLTLTGSKYFGDVNANLYTQLVAFDSNINDPAIKPNGTRLTLYPSISLPMHQSYGYITPKIGIHHTSYNLNNIANNLESQQRTLPIASIDSGLFFDRDFKISNRAYTQTIEPRLFYVYIPNTKQSDIPIFDSSTSDLNLSTLFRENQYTGNDRINNANQLSLSLTTRLLESDTGIQRLSASIGQRYYFADQKVSLPAETLRKSDTSDIVMGLTTYLKTNWNVNAFWQYNTADSKSARTTLASRFTPEPGKALNLSYTYRQDTSSTSVSNGINQYDLSGEWPLGQGWYGIGRANYSIEEKHIIETLAGIEYNAGCWQTRTVIQRVTTATANASYALFLQIELGGLASIGTDPLDVIKRSIPGYVSTGLIPDSY
ncbi:MAG: LPS-assembly protein LptD [Sulfuritalea sp.]|nr:LPS-assembly protein LptD [Sulfuritalea sp.]